MKKIYSAHQIYEQEIFYWMRSYKTVVRCINAFSHILKPIRTGKNSGTRYYITENNLNEFLRKFENNELNHLNLHGK